MSHKYFPHTEADIHDMLEAVGHKSLDQLFDVIPDSIRFKGDYDLPAGMSELELRRHLEQLGQQNTLLTIFAGAGIYDHYTPSVVPNIIARSEYLTSYTPYQAEISQGTLHYIFEFQSMMAELTGMDISNASMYDGATATAEAAIMAVAVAKKADTVLISATIDPKIRRVVDTYAHYHGIKTETIEAHDGTTDRLDLERKLAAGGVSGVVVQMPNYYGIVEDYTGFADLIHDSKALFIINSSEPRHTDELRRPVGGIYVLHRAPRAQDAGTNRGNDTRQPWQPRFRTHPASTRTTHTPAKGNIKHLLQPEPHGTVRNRLYVAHGQARTGRGSQHVVCRSALYVSEVDCDRTLHTGIRPAILQ